MRVFTITLCTGNAIVAAVYFLLAYMEDNPPLLLGGLIPLALCGVLLWILKKT
ncbi:MAG: hypothetical protein ABIH46_02940 [Chloroflexota bacterium]